jgi:hypothetical protein
MAAFQRGKIEEKRSVLSAEIKNISPVTQTEQSPEAIRHSSSVIFFPFVILYQIKGRII